MPTTTLNFTWAYIYRFNHHLQVMFCIFFYSLDQFTSSSHTKIATNNEFLKHLVPNIQYSIHQNWIRNVCDSVWLCFSDTCVSFGIYGLCADDDNDIKTIYMCMHNWIRFSFIVCPFSTSERLYRLLFLLSIFIFFAQRTQCCSLFFVTLFGTSPNPECWPCLTKL